MHTLDLEQQRYDSMLPPDNSFMEDAIEEKAAEIIERQGLEWLESRVDLKTWEKIVAACEAEALIEIRAEIEDAKWEWRNHFILNITTEGRKMLNIYDDFAEIGDGVYLGDCVKVGDKFRCEGLEVIDFFTMSNIDDTGRRIHIYVHTKGITIRAGCFKGTLDEFCMHAEDEGKYVYSMTVRGAAEAFAAAIHRQGKTGGWDK